jgi:regulator of sigma E protease
MDFIYFVIVLGIIVFIHELGHLIAAKSFGVYCKEFAIGMGPRIFALKGKETTYSIRLLPLGGFVTMAGEEGVDAEDIPLQRTIKGIKRYQRMIVMLAGIFMNILLAWVNFVGMYMATGKVNLAPKPIVAGVVADSPAARAGFHYGDKIVKLTFSDGTVIIPKDFYEVVQFIQLYTDETTFLVERDNTTIEIKVTPEYIKAENRYFVGLKLPDPIVKQINPIQAIGYGTQTLGSGIGLKAISGPVGIFKVTSQTAAQGISSLIVLIGVLSLNVGIFNLLPIPLLDGGRVLLTGIEMILRKPLNPKVESFLLTFSAGMMIALLLMVTWQDILRLL